MSVSERTPIALQGLLDPDGAKRRDMLREMESRWTADDIKHFVGTVRSLDTPTCAELCASLAEASTPILIDLLGQFAASADAGLRARAIEALGAVPGPKRVPVAVRLLAARDEAVVAGGCRLLGSAGDPGVRVELEGVLAAARGEAAVAAVAALRQLDCRGSVAALAAAAASAEPQVAEAALDALPTLSDDSSFPAERVAAVLASSAAPSVRAKAATALGLRPGDVGRAALLARLAAADEDQVRCAAARALGGHRHPDALRALLRKCAKSSRMAVAVDCRRALDAFDHATILACAGETLASTDTAIRIEAAATLGRPGFFPAFRILAARLEVERDAVVRAALVEAMGGCGHGDAWAAIRKLTADEPLVAFAAVTALGNLLSPERLHDFASLLREHSKDQVRESVLTRLVVYGRAHGLPEVLRPLITPFLDERVGRVATLVAEALGSVTGGRTIEDLLEACAGDRPGEFLDAAVGSLMRLAGGRALVLIERAGPSRLPALPAALARCKTFGEDGPRLCLQLARQAADNVAGAEACLNAAAVVEPEAVRQVLATCAEPAALPLVRAWARLSTAARWRAPLDVAKLLQSPVAAVRRAGLELLDHDSTDALLQVAVDMSLADGDAGVRQQARATVKRMVGA